jgi:hypothetical protein
MPLSEQIVYVFIIAIPIACVAWTITHEEIFREPREFCQRCSQTTRSAMTRKFFYLFTGEYCFSHYIAGAFLLITRFQLLYGGWRGYLLAFFALVWIANIYMSIYNRLRLDIKHEHIEIKAHEQQLPERRAA